jgi:hypothetical protein
VSARRSTARIRRPCSSSTRESVVAGTADGLVGAVGKGIGMKGSVTVKIPAPAAGLEEDRKRISS